MGRLWQGADQVSPARETDEHCLGCSVDAPT